MPVFLRSPCRWFVVCCLLAGAASSAFAQTAPAAPAKTPEETMPLVHQYCGGCHNVPRPDILPKRSWPAVIRTMADIGKQRTGKEYIPADVLRDITALYYGSSPAELPTLPFDEVASPGRSFVRRELAALTTNPTILNIAATKLKTRSPQQFLVCDGEQGKLQVLERAGKKWKERSLADIAIPIHTQVIDFDADDDLDIVVADLGLMPPVGALGGKVYLLRQDSSGAFSRELLQGDLHRVTDAHALDLDADGDLDIAVAEFGGDDAGSVFWLRSDGAGKFERRLLLKASGALNVSPADLDGDGKQDLVSLVAQEHETVVAFLNMGGGEFRNVLLARAPHPMYGSTSMSVVDLDQDHDDDILFTNGDAFDAQTDPKPYHGVQWLRNDGAGTFTFADIGRFYGAADAAAGDLDGDGDLDVVASSWVNYWNEPRRSSLIWYENDGKQKFSPHPISNRPAGLVTLELVDMTGDGLLDIVAGAFRMDLLLAGMGQDYRAAPLFPSEENPKTLRSRVVVFENKPMR
jgi:hypothetical protein